MANDGVGVFLVFIQEIIHARESYLVDIFLYLLLRHANTPVADGERLGILVQQYTHGQVAQFSLEVSLLSQRLQFLGSVHGVGHHFTEENLMV